MRRLERKVSVLACMVMLAAPVVAQAADGDPENGEALFRRCHAFGRHKQGPDLTGIIGRTAGTAEGFNYSDALVESGVVWTAETLDPWIEKPRDFLPGTRMSFPVLADAQDPADLIAYLNAASAE